MIDNYIADQSPRITMTLSEILANTPPVQTLAQATDVPGTNLEWMKTAAYLTGAWFGDLGELGTTEFRDSLFTGYLALGVTCKVSGVPYSWYGSAWVTQGATMLAEDLTLGTFGDSTCTLILQSVPGSVMDTDQSGAGVAIPGTGTTYYSINPAVAGLMWLGGGVRFVADGGIPGQTTAEMLNRSVAAYATNRRSLFDVAKIAPRVCLLIGGLSINDLQSLADGSLDSAADPTITNAKRIIKTAAKYHETVIYTTFLGFHNPAFTDSRNATIRRIMAYAADAISAYASTFKNVRVVDMRGLTCYHDFTWIPGMYDATGSVYLHLSTDGGAVLGGALRSTLSAMYSGAATKSLVYDFQSVWDNPASGMPSNTSVSAYVGATGVSGNTTKGELSVAFTAASNSAGVSILIGNVNTTALAGLLAGSFIHFEYDLGLRDSGGDYVDFYAETELQLANGGTLRVGNTFGRCSSRGPDGLSRITTHRTKLPINASALTGATVVVRITPITAGAYTAVMLAPRALAG